MLTDARQTVSKILLLVLQFQMTILILSLFSVNQMEESRKMVGSPFISSNGLNTIEMSPNEQIYECKICNNCFSSPIQLTTHYVTCHRLLPCMNCLSLFLNRNDLDNHNNHKHANDDSNCSQCALTFASNRLLVDHLHEVHQKKYCQMCSALVKCCAVNTLQTHVEHVHKMSRQIDRNNPMFSFDNLATNETFECLICRQQFHVHRLFTHSMSFHKFSLGFIFTNILEKRHTSPVLKAVENADNLSDFDARTLCTICKCKFTPFAPKILHCIYCHGLRVCRRCYRQFDGDEDFDAHASSCDIVDSNDMDQCRFCAEDITGDQDHMARVHRIDQTIYSEKIDEFYSVKQTSWISTNYLCNFCGDDLSSIVQNIDSLIKHYVIHHRFSQISIFKILKKSLVKLERNDTNDRARKLPFLEVEAIDKESGDGGVIFDFNSKMVKVIYSSATDSDSSGAEDDEDSRSIRPVYVCIFCPFSTAVKCMLAMHLGQKHGFTPKIEDNRCNACRKIFTTHTNLQRHYKNVHHKNNANPYECPFCSFTIKGKQKMRYVWEHLDARQLNTFNFHLQKSYCAPRRIFISSVFGQMDRLQLQILLSKLLGAGEIE